MLIRLVDTETKRVAEIDGQVWSIGEHGAAIVKGDLIEPVPLADAAAGAPPQPVHSVRRVPRQEWAGSAAGGIWIGADRGLFGGDAYGATQLFGDSIGRTAVRSILPLDDSILVGTDKGLFRVSEESVDLILAGSIWDLENADGETWIGTSRNAYLMTAGEPPLALFAEPTPVSDVVLAADSIWLLTNSRGREARYKSCFKMNGRTPTEVLSGWPVYTVAEVNRVAWFGTQHGIFLENEDRVGDVRDPVNAITVTKDGTIWVGTSKRGYRTRSGRVIDAIPEDPEPHFSVAGVGKAGGHMWFWGEAGAYRLDEDTTLLVRPDYFRIGPFRFSLGKTIGIREARYERQGRDPYSAEVKIEKSFEVILESDSGTFQEALSHRHYHPWRGVVRRFGYGLQQVHLRGRDSFGNTYSPETQKLAVLPVRIEWFAGWLFWGVFLFCLANRFSAVLQFVNDADLRPKLTLWSVDLLLVSGTFRKLLLGQYVRQLRRHYSRSEAVPCESTAVIGPRGKGRRVLVKGDSVAASRFLREAVSITLDWRRRWSFRSCALPVVVQWEDEDHATSNPDLRTLALAELSNLGEITDPKIAGRMLRNEFGVVIIRIADTVQRPFRQALKRFVRSSRAEVCVIVVAGTQEADIPGLVTVNLKAAGQGEPHAGDVEATRQEVDEVESGEPRQKKVDPVGGTAESPNDVDDAAGDSKEREGGRLKREGHQQPDGPKGEDSVGKSDGAAEERAAGRGHSERLREEIGEASGENQDEDPSE